MIMVRRHDPVPTRFPPLLIGVLAVVWVVSCRQSDPLPVLFEIPAFSLVDQDGAVFKSETLSGRPYLVNFFFSTCPTICVTNMAAIKAMHERWNDAGRAHRIVSITVDPDNDTPEVLKNYGLKLGSSFDRWAYLTGETASVRSLITEGFKTWMGERETNEDGVVDIGHGARVLLVDGAGRLRGLFDTNTNGLEQLSVAMESLGRP